MREKGGRAPFLFFPLPKDSDLFPSLCVLQQTERLMARCAELRQHTSSIHRERPHIDTQIHRYTHTHTDTHQIATYKHCNLLRSGSSYFPSNLAYLSRLPCDVCTCSENVLL